MPPRAPVYQLKVTLQGIRPPIWRRFQVPANFPLSKLHHVLQVVMGWDDYHLHQFIAAGEAYGVPDPDDWEEVHDERRVHLSRVLQQPKDRLEYEYDFGDGWEHHVVLEKVLPAENLKHPVCIAGRRACPPEDCGGIWGYESFLEAIRNPKHPEHEELLEWVGGEFDPEAFDLDALNRELQHIR